MQKYELLVKRYAEFEEDYCIQLLEIDDLREQLQTVRSEWVVVLAKLVV